MSHELVLVAGAAADAEIARRRRAVEHAASAVPGADRIELHETPHACVALIGTSPPCGDVAVLTAGDRTFRATVALSESGLRAAESGHSHRAGSESGHATAVAHGDGTIEITTDGFATVGTYWAEHGDQLLATTHLASLASLGLPATVDERGAIEYLAMLHPLDDHTTLRGASLLQPGSTLRWRAGRTDVTSTSIFVPGPAHGDMATTVATFGEVWRVVIGDAVERARSDRPLIGLSGGLDSRIVAAQWVRSGSRPIAYTYGDADSHEARVASALATRMSLPHLRVPVADDDMLTGAEWIADRLDGAHSPSQMYELWFTDRLRSVGDVIVNGLGGGTLMGDDKLMGVADTSSLVRRAWDRYSSDVAQVSPFVSRDVRGDLTTVVRESIGHSFEGFTDLDRSDRGIYWRIANRQFRWGNMFHSALRRIGIRPETPFLDGRFLAYAARLTPQQRLNGVLYLAAQRSLFPEIADIARSDDGNSPSHLHHAYWSGDRRFFAQLLELGARHPVAAARRSSRRAVDLATRRAASVDALAGVADRVRLRKDVFPADVFVRTRTSYAERLADSLDMATGTTGLFDDDAIDRAVRALRTGQPAHSAAAMGRVAALGAWALDYRRRADAYAVEVGSAR